MLRSTSIVRAILLACSLLWGSLQPGVTRAAPLTASMLSGWFTIVWGDGYGDSAPVETLYMLTDAAGSSTILHIDEAVARSLGGVLAFDRKHVVVRGQPGSDLSGQGLLSAFQVESVSLEDGAANPDVHSLVTGSQRWISILCKFADYTTEPKTLAFFQSMYASTYPGLDHYWREQSYDIANVSGSGAAGWFTLPQPRSYYVYDRDSDGNEDADLDRIAGDCTAAADSSVNFSDYVGIQMMLNGSLDCCAWGGGHYMTLDGIARVWSVTWQPPWAYGDISVIEHEMGHGFGLPHSSGDYGQTYDNVWDVMSSDRYNCTASHDATYGCIAQHTISYHKDMLGWFSDLQMYTAGGSETKALTLEQLALPSTSSYRMARIPIAGSAAHFYTVEARRQAGYDVKLPGNAVVIHEVDTTRDRPAHVIDVDNDGDTSDAGAMWLVGETFSDDANGISVHVDSTTATGFNITIGCWNDCLRTPVDVLTNGGYEEPGSAGTPSLPYRWRVDNWSASAGVLQWDSAEAHTGAASVKIDSWAPNDARWLQTVDVQPNAEYRLSGWIKTLDVTHSQESQDAGANLSLYGTWTRSSALFGTNDWTYVSLPFTTTTESQVTVAARLGYWSGTTTGTAWFDDLKLELLSTPICHALSSSSEPADAGTVGVSPAPNCPDGTQFAHGTVVRLMPIPGEGWAFGSWSGAASGRTTPLYLDMTADRAVVARYGPLLQAAYRSSGRYDGYIVESGETTSTGGAMNATAGTVAVGDSARDRQYRSILSFNTAGLPDGAILTSATLQVRLHDYVGSDPFGTLGELRFDVRKGPFSGATPLQLSDFRAPAGRNSVLAFASAPAEGIFMGALQPADLIYINKKGVTQFRLRFLLGDNDNRSADYLRLYSGNYAADASYRPSLVINYITP